MVAEESREWRNELETFVLPLWAELDLCSAPLFASWTSTPTPLLSQSRRSSSSRPPTYLGLVRFPSWISLSLGFGSRFCLPLGTLLPPSPPPLFPCSTSSLHRIYPSTPLILTQGSSYLGDLVPLCFTPLETTPSRLSDEDCSSRWRMGVRQAPPRVELPTPSSSSNSSILISSPNLILSTTPTNTSAASSSGRTDSPSRTSTTNASSSADQVEDTEGQRQRTIHPHRSNTPTESMLAATLVV